MDDLERKPKRPRISESKVDVPENNTEERYEKVSYNPESAGERPVRTDYNDRNYNQRPYNNRQGGYNQSNYNNNRQGGYNNRQGGYNQQRGGYNNNRPGGYNQGGYNNNRNNNFEGTQEENQNNYNTRQGDYNNRNTGYNNNRQGGYDQQRSGYNNRQQGSGFGNNREGGYDQQRSGYNNRQQGSGFGNNREGGYDQQRSGYNNRQGGYNNRQGGFNNRQGGGGYNNRQGSYNNRQGGGYNNNRQGGGFNNRQGGGFNPQMHFIPRPKRVEYELPEIDPSEPIRLNKFMANAGVCSRREADELIQQGQVKVNGTPVTELGTKITRNDVVEYQDKVVTLESKCYILLNKPKDCVTTSDDPNGRLTVMDLVKNACPERIYPVGRLDRNTTGVLLLTNDGDLASKLTHPKYIKKKIYHVWVDKDISEEDMQRIADGIELEDGPIHADAISYVSETDRNQAGIEIHSGRNRIVRRIFEALGYHVTKLDRVYFAGLTKKNLPRGRWRYLSQEEVNFLKQSSFE